MVKNSIYGGYTSVASVSANTFYGNDTNSPSVVSDTIYSGGTSNTSIACAIIYGVCTPTSRCICASNLSRSIHSSCSAFGRPPTSSTAACSTDSEKHGRTEGYVRRGVGQLCREWGNIRRHQSQVVASIWLPCKGPSCEARRGVDDQYSYGNFME
ncbi:hypothetical protein PF008_g16021 [Phytophthora fragariae]|uniref:Uncharacterized protein n=1 Tax=Phytophthora fragariae TaxID=53985 RepID=A0A6G0RDS0_9STRA|nr:hypothetical protein PF008_g16021 [Phytophthora fragariae]